MKYAVKKILDSYWFLAYENEPDGSIRIHGHWRDEAPKAHNFDKFVKSITENFVLVEGGGRVVFQARLGKFHPFTGEWTEMRCVAVANPEFVFQYGGPI